MWTMLFMCPGSSLRQRLQHRRAKRQQRQAMREATAHGWNQQDDDDENSEGLGDEHHHWETTTNDDPLHQYFAAAKENDTAKETTTPSKRTPANFGTLKLFTPEYFEISTDSPARTTSPTVVQPYEESSDSDDSSDSPPENAPESSLAPEVAAMLDHIQRNTDGTDTTETTVTETTESSSEPLREVQPRVSFLNNAAADHNNNNPDHNSSSDSDEDNHSRHTSDSDDSVDYGGAELSMWKSVGGTQLASIPDVPPVSAPPPPPTSTDLLIDDDEEDDVDHQGAEVFLYTQSQTNYDTQNNMLFDIQEAPAEVTEMELLNPMTSAAKIPFSPRILEEDEEDPAWEDLTFSPNGTTYKSPTTTKSLKLSQMLSPDPNDALLPKQPPESLMSPLSAMVHPMNLDLFREDEADEFFDESFSSIATESVTSIHSCPVDVHRQFNSNASVGSRTAASFRSSASKIRVRYNLSTGKKSMSKEQRRYSKAFLPKSLLPELATPKQQRKKPNIVKDHTLSVLLVHVDQHVFEVIAVDCYYKDDCTVGDVLSKARSSATDPALSEQKYVSLVCGRQEFAAPMLPIHIAVDFRTKHPLALAVPEGSTGTELQAIKRVLWKNPKMKRWWNVEDPFQPTVESIREIHVPSPKNNRKESPETMQQSPEDTTTQQESPGTNTMQQQTLSPTTATRVGGMLRERTEL